MPMAAPNHSTGGLTLAGMIEQRNAAYAAKQGEYTSRGPEWDVFTFSPNANGVGAGEGAPLIARTPLA
jgi:hypothetical protein